MMHLLLDSHIMLWIVAPGSRLLSARANRIVTDAASVQFSIVSLWEIAIKAAKGQGDSMKTPHWMRRMARFLSSWKYSIARITEGRMVLQMVRTKLVSEKMLAGALSLRLVY